MNWKRKLTPCAAAVGLMAIAGTVQANLVLLGPENFSGTGLGAVNTVLTMQSPGDASTEAASVAWNGSADVIAGDAKTGASQTQTRSFADLGITSASLLRVVFNAIEPGGANNSINLTGLTLNVFSAAGSVLFSASYTGAPHLFADTFTGAGNSGFVFGLDAPEAATLQAILNQAGSGADRVGIASSATLATGGPETIFIASSVSAVPEPETYGMLAAGLGLLGFISRRRKTRDEAA